MNEKYFSGANKNIFFEKVSHSLVKGSVLVRYWFGDFSHGSGFGSAEPKNPGSVVHYSIIGWLMAVQSTVYFKSLLSSILLLMSIEIAS